jgi:hypothetical protein
VQGTLLVTSERILLDSPPHSLWQRPLSKLLRVGRRYLPEGPIVFLWLDGLQKPVGLGIADVQLDVPVGNHTGTIKLDAGDLTRLLQALAGWGSAGDG